MLFKINEFLFKINEILFEIKKLLFETKKIEMSRKVNVNNVEILLFNSINVNTIMY